MYKTNSPAMGFTKFFIITILNLQLLGCSLFTDRYSIKVNHFAGAVGLTIYYTLTDKSITVDTNCDFADCKGKTVYTRTLTTQQADSLLAIFKQLHLDSLKSYYQPPHPIFDGLVSSIKLRGSELPHKNITIDNVDVPAADSLYKIIDNLVLSKKYKFYHFGRE